MSERKGKHLGIESREAIPSACFLPRQLKSYLAELSFLSGHYSAVKVDRNWTVSAGQRDNGVARGPRQGGALARTHLREP